MSFRLSFHLASLDRTGAHWLDSPADLSWTDIPLGEARWLTVVSPDDPEGPELLLEPDTHPAAGPFKAALVAEGTPATSFAVDDVHAEFQRLGGLGVRFTQEPLEMGAVTTAVFDDTCGNLIQIAKR